MKKRPTNKPLSEASNLKKVSKPFFADLDFTEIFKIINLPEYRTPAEWFSINRLAELNESKQGESGSRIGHIHLLL